MLIDKEFKNLDLNNTLQDFCDSFGLLSERDKEKSCFRIFIELIKAEKNRDRLSSEEIASKSNLSRATVIHHIERLENSCLIKSKKNRYFLASPNLEKITEDIEKEMFRLLKKLKKTAKKLDKDLSLPKKKDLYIINYS